MKKNRELEKSLEKLLKAGLAKTQSEIVFLLEKEGFVINQSKISRLLKKLGAIKISNEYGEFVYSLSKDPPLPKKDILIKDLVFSVACNESLLFIATSPGAASIVARILDHNLFYKILGTLAGDDAVLVIPKSIKDLELLKNEVQKLLNLNNIS